MGTDKTPLERRVESRVKAAELHGTLAARWYGEDVPALQAEVVRLRQERDDLRTDRDNLSAAWKQSRETVDDLFVRVERLREALQQAGLALIEASIELDHAGKQVASSDAHQAQKDVFAALASPDKPPERVVRTTITDLDAFN